MKKAMAVLLSASLLTGLCISGAASDNESVIMDNSQEAFTDTLVITTDTADKAGIEEALTWQISIRNGRIPKNRMPGRWLL